MFYWLHTYTLVDNVVFQTAEVGDKLHWNHKFKQAVKSLCNGNEKDVSSINFKFSFNPKSGDVCIQHTI